MAEDDVKPDADESPDVASDDGTDPSADGSTEGSADESAEGAPVADDAASETAGPEGAFPLEEFDNAQELPESAAMKLLGDVDLDVTIELGRTRMMVEDVLKLSDGAVVELDKLAGDPVDIYVNERLVARGEVLVLNDNFSIRVSEILDVDAIEEAHRTHRATG